MTALNKLG